jgi:hypothetical protein
MVALDTVGDSHTSRPPSFAIVARIENIIGCQGRLTANNILPMALLQSSGVQPPFCQTDWPRTTSFPQPLVDNFELLFFLPAPFVPVDLSYDRAEGACHRQHRTQERNRMKSGHRCCVGRSLEMTLNGHSVSTSLT